MIINQRVREILALRSSRDKFAIPVNCALLDPEDLKVVSDLVREGYVVWLDRAVVSDPPIYCDVYLLTAKGVALCNSLEITWHYKRPLRFPC